MNFDDAAGPDKADQAPHDAAQGPQDAPHTAWARPETQVIGSPAHWWSATPAYPAQPAPGSAGWQQPGWQPATAPWQPVDVAAAPAPSKHRARTLVAGIALIAVGAAAGAGIVDVARHSGTTVAASQPALTQPATQPGTATGNGLGGTFGGGTFGGGTSGSGASGSGSGSSGSGSGTGSSGTGSSGSSGSTSTGDAATAKVAQDVDPGIVDITTTVSGGEAAGTGMVLTSTGEILTNNHVINGATSISVRDVGNGKTYGATVVGYDRTEDVAILQLTNASGLTTVKTDSTVPSTGASVVGVGNAGGTGGTPSYAGGTVTATNQSITASDSSDGTSEQLTGLIETNAAIQPGDSGGPLVNSSGAVVGMDTAASSSYSFQGNSSSASQGFAIPIATALKIASEIVGGQSSSTVHIGATAQLGVYIGSEQDEQGGTSGALVEQTTSTSPAAKAGIVAGDTITAINGTSVDSPDQLASAISEFKPGQTVTVSVTTQDGTNQHYSVTLGTGSPQ